MPVPLVYEISVTGEDKLKRALRSIESEAKASSSRTESDSRRSVARRTTAARDPVAKQAARGFDQIGRAARAAETKQIRDRMAGDKRASAARLRHIAREERAAIRAAKMEVAARSRGVRQASGSLLGSVGSSVKGVVGMGANALALGGGLLGGVAAGSAIESEIAIRAKASQLANQAGNSALKGDIASESKGVVGFSGMESIGALEQFVNLTGDLKTGRDLLQSIGQMALATGTDIGDMAGVAGNAWIPILDQMKDATPEARLSALRDVMAGIAGQGAVGAVEIKDLASEFAALAATSNKFEGSTVENMKLMGAITQAARQRGGAGSSAEAVTSTARFASDVAGKSSVFKALGIDVLSDDKTQLRDPRKIIADTLEKTQGNVGTITNLFGERSARAVAGFAPLYNDAERKKKGTGAGAVAAEFDRLMRAQKSSSELLVAAQSREADEDIRITEATKRFNDVIGTRLIPVLTTLVPKFTEMIPAMGDLAGVVAGFATDIVNNPIPSIGKIIAAKVGLDLATMGLGEVVKSGMNTALQAATGGAVGAGGVLSVFVTGGMVGVSVGAMVGEWLGGSQDRLTKPGDVALQTREELAQSQTDIARGGTGGKLGDKGQILGRKNALEGMLASLQNNAPTALETAAGAGNTLIGGKSAEEARQASVVALQAAIDKLSAALGKGGDEFVAKVASANVGGGAENAPRRSLPIGAR